MARYGNGARYPSKPNVPEQGSSADAYEAPPLASKHAGMGGPGSQAFVNRSETMPGEGTHADGQTARTPQC